jgi:hypothetical protein
MSKKVDGIGLTPAGPNDDQSCVGWPAAGAVVEEVMRTGELSGVVCSGFAHGPMRPATRSCNAEMNKINHMRNRRGRR